MVELGGGMGMDGALCLGLYLHTYISSLIKNRVGDDGTRAILQYRPSDLYLTDGN